MDNLVRIIPNILRSVDSKEVKEAAAIAAWKHAAGDGLRSHAIPLRLEERTLIVAVADPVWQKQLSAMCAQLVFRVNALLGQSLVSRIDLRIDPSVIKIPNLPRKTTATLQENEVPLELWSAASAIADKNLRQTFLKAAITATRRLEKQRTET